MTYNARVPSGINRFFYRNLVLDKPQLFKKIVQFNASVNLEAGKKNNSENNNTLIENIFAGNNRAKLRFYNGTVTAATGFWDFEEESRRLALLDAATVNDLILCWGAALCAPILNRFVLKSDIEILNREIGRKYLDFAMGKGRFILGNISEVIKLEEKNAAPEMMRTMMIKYGIYAHSICSANWPDALLNFEEMKIKHCLPDLFEYFVEHREGKQAQSNPSHFRVIWFSIKKILLKEVAPQWSVCFI